MNTTPASLLEQLRQPAAEGAWETFARLYTPLLFYWARRLGLQDQDAADLVQDVFAVLVQKLPEFAYDRHRSFRAWLRTITLNKWRDAHRRPASQHLRPGDEPVAPQTVPADPDVFAEEEYRKRLLARALELMQTDFQTTTWRAFWEHGICGRSAPAVAAELGLSVGAVYAAKVRVLDRLRKELQGLLD
jgi:RNA polymerase sigma-70 factor (ECF subfamily)